MYRPGSSLNVNRQNAFNHVWAVGEGLPHRWRAGIVDAWEQGADVHKLRRDVSSIKAAISATDDDLRAHADAAAKLVDIHAGIGDKGGTLMAAHRLCALHRVDAAKLPYDDPLTYWRIGDSRWWLGQIRKAHAQAMEEGAVRLGLVHQYAGGDCYVSRESIRRHRQMSRRNRRMIEAHDVTNDRDVLQLASVVDASIANRSIRRGELMMRLRGFEMIGDQMGHKAMFVTLTCPSRFHRYAGNKARWWPNPNYKGATPADAQAYLCSLWARFRAKLHRDGLRVYGFRIAEPHHDGCPHWHLLLWAESRDKRREVAMMLRDYALLDSPGEPGAKQHRCRIRNMWKGGACAYVAKYIAKHTDGFALSEDLLGVPIAESTERVQVWSSAWRIRQFQQIGGPPIGLWRELRRIDQKTLSSESEIADLVATCNKGDDGRVDFAGYLTRVGGVFCRRRDLRLSLVKRERVQPTRYGDRSVARVVGVCGVSGEVVETRPHRWRVVRRATAPCDLGLVSITVRKGVDDGDGGAVFGGGGEHRALLGAERLAMHGAIWHRDGGSGGLSSGGAADLEWFAEGET